MGPRIVFVKQFTITDELVREIAPADFDLAIVDAGSPEYEAAIGKAEYLVGFVDASIDDALYAAAPRLKLIQMMSAGYDRADLAAARRAGVPVANNGGANSVAVSEHAMLLMLAVSRRLISQHANVVAGRWRGNTTPKLHELYGKTLGIVGLGTIGKKTARLAAAFGMNVNYYDIVRLPEDGADALGVEFRLLGELMRSSDEAFMNYEVSYAQAWSMVYLFLMHAPARHRARFRGYLDLLRQGRSRDESFRATFGKVDLTALEKEWKAMLRQLASKHLK